MKFIFQESNKIAKYGRKYPEITIKSIRNYHLKPQKICLKSDENYTVRIK